MAAVTATLFAPTSLMAAMRRLGFVQADPIRAPARAQDLILRHRVKGYVAGDLERKYPHLDLDEDFVYAYGFIPRENLHLLYPKTDGSLSALETEVLAVVREHGPLHPNDLRKWFGNERVINAWGGYSKATKAALERLHKHGLLRIARRDRGVRVYAATMLATSETTLSAQEQMRALIGLVMKSLAPVPERTLSSVAAYVGRHITHSISHRVVIRQMLSDGELRKEQVDGMAYLLPAGRRSQPEPDAVRLLAPFDPVVWDRRRFEHLWGWEYRFEAYTPLAKRVRGYYALPLLWRSMIVGWANVTLGKNDLEFEYGFIAGKPRGVELKRALAIEVERFRTFMRRENEKHLSDDRSAILHSRDSN